MIKFGVTLCFGNINNNQLYFFNIFILSLHIYFYYTFLYFCFLFWDTYVPSLYLLFVNQTKRTWGCVGRLKKKPYNNVLKI